MIILGLGSNQGDRLDNLRRARELLSLIPQLRLLQVSPLYLSNALLPEQALESWDQPYLNLALRCETNLQPLDLLQKLKNVEYTIGRKPLKRHWGPRVIDIDILAWDELILKNEQLQIPHAHLPERPFALWPLSDLTPNWIYPLSGPYQGKTAAEISSRWGSRFSGQAPLQTRQISHRIDTPRLVGILNLTPDSFSDGNQFPKVQAALSHAYHLANTGAEILDLGAEATNPEALPLDPLEEWERLEPVLSALKTELNYMILPPKISIDTRHVEVAEKALHLGIDWLNDTSGLENPAMRALVASSQRDCVMMHNLGLPADRNRVLPFHHNPIEQIKNWGEARLAELEDYGIPREKIIFDVGLGFGKNAEQSFALIKDIQAFQTLGTRLLVGHSRKSFLTLFTNKAPADRDLETAILSLHLDAQGVDYLRVHDTETCSRSFNLARALS
ncbi:MAG TPA: dihydropteroate synthase [Gammaproteobacteria bacterium]|nr:dihydropteroate synthase [Gammaproteobacteria bacterium]